MSKWTGPDLSESDYPQDHRLHSTAIVWVTIHSLKNQSPVPSIKSSRQVHSLSNSHKSPVPSNRQDLGSGAGNSSLYAYPTKLAQTIWVNGGLALTHGSFSPSSQERRLRSAASQVQFTYPFSRWWLSLNLSKPHCRKLSRLHLILPSGNTISRLLLHWSRLE